MNKPLTIHLIFLLLVLTFSASAATAAMDPAPADRSRYDHKREPGQFKWTNSGMLDPRPDVISLEYLPVDDYGFVDWSKAIRDRVIAPKEALPGEKAFEESEAAPGDVLIRSKMEFMPDVIFPHAPHTVWLKCSNCHPKIFKQKAGGNDITMAGIWKGEHCGRCHDRVAFPTRNCFRCHSAPRKAAR